MGTLVVFAREPIPGRVKTRLAEGVGAALAASIYTALFDHTLATARESGDEIVVSLASDPDPSWAAALGCRIEIQGRGDLGERMAECFRRRFAEGATRGVIVGSDNAHLRSDHLRSAMAALDARRVVLGPAVDGGYWLVGQRTPGIDLFSGISWSSPETLDATRSRLRAAGVEWSELETLPDIDTVEDLRRAIEDPRLPAALRERLASSLRLPTDPKDERL